MRTPAFLLFVLGALLLVVPHLVSTPDAPDEPAPARARPAPPAERPGLLQVEAPHAAPRAAFVKLANELEPLVVTRDDYFQRPQSSQAPW